MITCESKPLKNVSTSKYLGTLFTADGLHSYDNKAKIARAYERCGQLRKIFDSPAPSIQLKLRIYIVGVCSLITFGSETSWNLSPRELRQLNNANSLMLSHITGKSFQEEARPWSTSFNLVRSIRRPRLKWLDQILRKAETNMTYQAILEHSMTRWWTTPAQCDKMSNISTEWQNEQHQHRITRWATSVQNDKMNKIGITVTTRKHDIRTPITSTSSTQPINSTDDDGDQYGDNNGNAQWRWNDDEMDEGRILILNGIEDHSDVWFSFFIIFTFICYIKVLTGGVFWIVYLTSSPGTAVACCSLLLSCPMISGDQLEGIDGDSIVIDFAVTVTVIVSGGGCAWLCCRLRYWLLSHY